MVAFRILSHLQIRRPDLYGYCSLVRALDLLIHARAWFLTGEMAAELSVIEERQLQVLRHALNLPGRLLNQANDFADILLLTSQLSPPGENIEVRFHRRQLLAGRVAKFPGQAQAFFTFQLHQVFGKPTQAICNGHFRLFALGLQSLPGDVKQFVPPDF